jgi:hypothetical protein
MQLEGGIVGFDAIVAVSSIVVNFKCLRLRSSLHLHRHAGIRIEPETLFALKIDLRGFPDGANIR